MKIRSKLISVGKFGVISALFVGVLIGVVAVPEINRRESVEDIRNTVHEATDAVRQPIDFTVKQIKSYAHNVGHKEIQQEGVAGVKEIKYAVQVRGDGVETMRNQIAETVVVSPVEQVEIIGAKLPGALTEGKGAHIFVDSKGVSHRETYYDLPMNVVMNACGGGGYTVREDGAKIDKDGYVIVAANYANYPRCSVVETSMGPGKVYDTGSFAQKHPHGFDLATDWTKGDGI